MRLVDSKDIQEQVAERLSIAYGHMVTDDYVEELTVRLGRIEADVVIQAVNAHIENSREGNDRRPIGSRPPTAADLLGQIARIEELQRREARQDDFQQKYTDAARTPVPEKWQSEWRETLRQARINASRREEICQHLRRTCGLSFMDNPRDGDAWMAVNQILREVWISVSDHNLRTCLLPDQVDLPGQVELFRPLTSGSG